MLKIQRRIVWLWPRRDQRIGGLRTAQTVLRGVLVVLALALLWLGATMVEWVGGRRVLPWDPYASCGASTATTLPETIRIGLYEEFPDPWRLKQLSQVDFPITLAILAPSRAAFLERRAAILRDYPQVREVYFWPLLSDAEGYYPGTWSDAAAVERVAAEAADLPVLWDLEMPRDKTTISLRSWASNRAFLDRWLRDRSAPVHIWRSHNTMGLDPLFLHLIGMHFDPREYGALRLHLDLYETGSGLGKAQMARMLRCGVERYSERFIPSLGVLNDGEGPASIFVSTLTLRRDLQLARAAGVQEIWLFGVNGLNAEYLSVLRETLPLEPLSSQVRAQQSAPAMDAPFGQS
jgi:hypothetical protein